MADPNPSPFEQWVRDMIAASPEPPQGTIADDIGLFLVAGGILSIVLLAMWMSQ